MRNPCLFIAVFLCSFNLFAATETTAKKWSCSSHADNPPVTVLAEPNGELQLPNMKVQMDPATTKALMSGDAKSLNHASSLSKDGTHLSFRASAPKLSEQTYLEIRVDSKNAHEVLDGCWATSDADQFLTN